MTRDLLEALIELTGCPEETIRERCDSLPLFPQTILEFHVHYTRFPTDNEAWLIADIGLANFNSIYCAGIIPA